ncbi:MAG: polymerase subunit gamma/tau [Candidatus Saccharibacteria bacterium]|nr:polymerase subunit gamma/tau [Candidatus Saccharibacteria bacterium]
MGQALYRTYRSKKLSEIVGQEHITTALTHALKKGTISHAYLFTGPRGVGKTSIARILAHEVNGLPYEDDTTHLDIIEIDAASNRRIDEIRELRERVHSAPTSGKYKVYIIDEVHMLTKEAFNALLKTLEEPPAHVIFILATTESHKLPETIISRTQRYTFKPIDAEKVVDHLAHIAESEGISISREALQLVAEHGEGSFRDSISLLDQVSNMTGTIEREHVQIMLGIAPEQAITELMSTLSAAQINELLQSLKGLYNQGFQAAHIAKQVSARLRDELLNGNATDKLALTKTLRELIDVPSSNDPETSLELILLEYALHAGGITPAVKKPAIKEAAITTAVHETATPITKAKVKAAAKEPVIETPKTATPEPEAVTETVLLASSGAPLDDALWQQILQAIKLKHNTLYTFTRTATPRFNGQEITLCFGFPFHQKRLNEAKNKQFVLDIIHEVTGQEMRLNCIVDKGDRVVPVSKPAAIINESSATSASGTPLEAISNIFGGAEVLES